MVSPIEEAFDRIIREIYWIDSLDEAEERLTGYLEQMDPDLREVLLEERQKICEDPDVVIRLIRVEALADSAENRELRDLLLLRSLVEMLFLVQCSPKWADMNPREKAHILAPLYKAWHGMRLAAKPLPESVDKIHLSIAYTMAEEAYERAERYGLVDDVFGLINRLSEKLLQEYEQGD